MNKFILIINGKKLFLLIKIFYMLNTKIQTVNFTFGKNLEIIEPVNFFYNCTVGDDCFKDHFLEIQEDVVICKKNRIQSHSFICSKVKILNNCFIGHGVMFVNDKFETFKTKWEE